MMQKNFDQDAEETGIQKAVYNLDGDPEAIARYVYTQCAAYQGADHEKIATRYIAVALNAMQAWCNRPVESI